MNDPTLEEALVNRTLTKHITFQVSQGYWGDIDFEYDFLSSDNFLKFIAIKNDDEPYALTVQFPIKNIDENEESLIILPIRCVTQILYTHENMMSSLPTVLVFRLSPEGIKKMKNEVPQHFERWQKMLDNHEKKFKCFSDCLIFVIRPLCINFCNGITEGPFQFSQTIDWNFFASKLVSVIVMLWKEYLLSVLKWKEEDSCNLIEVLEKPRFEAFYRQFGLDATEYHGGTGIIQYLFKLQNKKAESSATDPNKNHPTEGKIEVPADSDVSSDEELWNNMEDDELELIESEVKRQNGEKSDQEKSNQESPQPSTSDSSPPKKKSKYTKRATSTAVEHQMKTRSKQREKP